jgi:hypothetical protein
MCQAAVNRTDMLPTLKGGKLAETHVLSAKVEVSTGGTSNWGDIVEDFPEEVDPSSKAALGECVCVCVCVWPGVGGWKGGCMFKDVKVCV